jgi:hypothetical protein
MRLSHLVFIVALVTVAGCAKTNLTNLWRATDNPAPVQSILVISLERDDDLRRSWEDAIVAEFQAAGVMARPAYSLFPASLPDSQQVVTVTRRDGYDGVVVSHRIAGAYNENLGNDYAKNAPGGAGNYWRGWYHTHFMQASQSAPFDEGEARFQLDLANTVGGGQLLWMGSTLELDPRDAKKVQKEVCGELVSELMRRGYVTKR